MNHPHNDAPAWDIESEYPSLASAEFRADLELVQSHLETMERELKKIDLAGLRPDAVAPLQALLRKEEHTGTLISNLSTFVTCLLSVNAADEPARAEQSKLELLSSKQGQLFAPVRIFLKRCPGEILEAILQDPALAGYRFQYQRERELAPFLLSENEEVLLRALSISGHTAWANLYTQLTGKGQCVLNHSDGTTETRGLAATAALLYGPDHDKRKAAWHSIQAYWNTHRESTAAVANALASWRIELCRKRSHTKPSHFLDVPLFANRISRETLYALLGSCYQNVERSRQALKLMAKALKKDRLDPWDLLGPSPITGGSATRTFAEGMQMVREAFGKVDPQMSDFADRMVNSRWIEARVLPKKAGGAFSTTFQKSITPRIFQTYMGSLPNITTLAHELGHAFHSWAMRDLPRGERSYPMTLAETASVFAETALRDTLSSRASSREEKIEFLWSDLSSIGSFLINIPARFEYENSFYEKSAKGSQSADDLCALTDQAWTKWYGPTLSENDKLFWASKMHFSVTRASFYNFPYTFGYLFALSIYARRKDLGDKFMPTYVNILRDTGRMTAEDLVKKHLGEDIRQPAFWQKAIDGEIAKIHQFASLLG
jgi:oligoendopeptidase F